MSANLHWIGAAVAIFASTCAAATVHALTEFSRSDLEEICRRGRRPKLFADVLARHEAVAIGVDAFRVLTLVIFAISSIFGIMQLAEANEAAWQATLVGGAAAVALVAIVGELWIPRLVAKLAPESYIYNTWPIWRVTSMLMAPVSWGGRALELVVRRMAGMPARDPVKKEEQIENEIMTIVTEGHREGLLEEEARGMIEGIIDLRDATVSEIMTPRIDMASMPVGRTLDEAVAFVIQAGHSRIPIYDKSRDDIVGILYAKDLLVEMAQQPRDLSRSLSSILRPPTFVPETKPLRDLLQEFQHSRNHMAVVLDEYGGVSGLVTIEDVLEEIVGEIADEYDDALVDGIKKIDEKTSEVMARVPIEELNERLGLALSEEQQFDTIGGYVFSELGRIPKVGEVIELGNLRITVLDVTRRRIERLRIEVLDQPQHEPA